tara:strand:- start:290 stop:529 length:240 start_codon:yes stop_codon:yes gene_type:complete
MEVVIYSKNNCPNCEKVKIRLSKYKPQILFLEKDISREDFFKKFPNSKTVPQIIIDDKHIGGYNELEKWLAFNKPDEDF